MRSFLIKAACLLLLCTPSLAHAANFQDVSTNDWFHQYTSYLADQGIISPNPRFNPYKPLTRAELVKMAVGAANRLGIESHEEEAPLFCDVPTNHWAITYINQLARRQVISGTATTNCSTQRNFYPERSISRAETIKIVFEVFGIGNQGTARFSDVANTMWYSSYINSADQLRIVSGYTDGTFRPNATISRAEMSKVLVNVIRYYQNENGMGESSPAATPTPTPTPTPTSTITVTPTPTTTQTSSATLPAGSLTIISIGDSLTAGDRDDSGLGYPGRLEDRIAAIRPGSQVRNLGVSGVNSSTLVSDQLPQARNARPHIVTILIGSNDMWEDGWNDHDSSASTIATYTENINTILSQLRAANITVFVGLVDDQSRRPVASDGMGLNDEQRARMSRISRAFNQAITTAASRHNAHVVDFYNTTIFTNPSTLSDDGNHPNAQGYEAMSNLWFNAINNAL